MSVEAAPLLAQVSIALSDIARFSAFKPAPQRRLGFTRAPPCEKPFDTDVLI
jgi:hypothetical protein